MSTSSNHRPGRVRVAALLAVAALVLSVLTVSPSSARTRSTTRARGAEAASPSLPAPPVPGTTRPTQPRRYTAPSPRTRTASLRTASLAEPASAVTWGDADGGASTLVLYDTGDAYGWLGELYAMAAGNLAGHFGTVTAEPVRDYVAGQVDAHTATVYLGSTYNEALPVAFLDDVLATTRPVVWTGYNVWQLAGDDDSRAAFATTYGWDPSTSYFDAVDDLLSVRYGTTELTRNAAAGPVLAPHLTPTETVAPTTLATVRCSDEAGTPHPCDGIAQTVGDDFPWAIRSGNLTYVGEIPFSYLSESDRYLAFADLLYDALDPTAATDRRALVRLEDVSPGTSSPAELRAFADELWSRGVPFSVAVIPDYEDPNGVYDGVPTSSRISDVNDRDVVAFDDALRYMVARGGTLLQHGTTHQWSDVANPYDAVSADDFELYRARCSTTREAPYDFSATCADTDWVVGLGPLPGDSAAWAADRVRTGRAHFPAAGLPSPRIWETPHYAASAADYTGIAQTYGTRYERTLYFGGQLRGTPAADHVFGQLYPYVVHDAYGTTVLPEDLGNYEPEPSNNNPPRTPADIVANARALLAVRQGVASFFFHPYYDLARLEQVVEGIQALGYRFVTPASLLRPTADPLAITTTALPAGAVGTPYLTTLLATGGTGARTWSITGGSLPAGLTLDPTTGTIAGTPTRPATVTVTVAVRDAGSPPDSATAALRLVVTVAPLVITTSSLPPGTVGTPYTATLTATGGVPPRTWSIAAGTLPAGLSLAPSGVVSGTPTRRSSVTVTFRVRDAQRPARSATRTLPLTVTTAPLKVTTSALADATVGTSYRQQLTASGGVTPYRWSLAAGSLPAGLVLDAKRGSITGRPRTAGTSTMTVRVTDSDARASAATAILTLRVTTAPLAITTTSLPPASRRSWYSAPLHATGGAAPYRWTLVSGTLPFGLALSPSGTVSGVALWGSSATLTFRVADSASPAASATVTTRLVVR